MRGTHRWGSYDIEDLRIIPAHAGNSQKGARSARHAADHPRACGELIEGPDGAGKTTGSSPRMRGTLWQHRTARSRPRIIPAHAGNSPRHPPDCPQLSDHPRACGELDSQDRLSTMTDGSSPRMRGTRVKGRAHGRFLRIIPAHAGNSAPDRFASSRMADHPRACGELHPPNPNL